MRIRAQSGASQCGTARSRLDPSAGLKLCRLLASLILASLIAFDPVLIYAKPGDAGRLLTFGSSARDVSLGGAVAAVPQGANSLYWNPSLLSDVSRKDLAFLQAKLFGQTNLNWFGYAHPFKKRAGTLALQMLQLKAADGLKRNAFNDQTGNFSYNEQVTGIGYGFHPTRSEKFALGIGFNMLKRSLDNVSNTLYGFNVGADYQFFSRLRTGLVLENILRGKDGDTDDSLPMGLKIGNAFEIMKGFFVTGDMDMSNFKSPAFNFGTEYSWRFFSIRAGRPADGDFALGFGLNWKWARMDLAISSQKDLGTSQILSFGISFGKDRTVTRKALAAQYFAQAQELYAKGEWIQAQALLEKSAKIDPLDVPINLRAARINEAIKNLYFSPKKKAAQDEQAQFIGADDAARLIKEGVKSFIEGNDQDAALLLRQAATYRQADKRLADFLAYLLKSRNIKLDEVEPSLNAEEVITLKLKKVENFFDAARYDEALKVCEELVKIAPEMVLPRVRLGSVYYAMGDMLHARKEYERALQLNPDDQALKEFMVMQGWAQ